MKKISILISSLSLLFAMSCSDDAINQSVSSTQVIHHFADKIAMAIYTDMKAEATILDQRVQALKTNPTTENLSSAQSQWYKMRQLWEYSEAFLFGPIADLDLDPAWDDWPVNHNDFDAIIASTDVLSADYVASLATSSKGFHALEYILFGKNKNRNVSELSTRQLEYALALSSNIASIATTNYDAWTTSTGFLNILKYPSATNTTFPNHKSALLEVATALIGICEETGAEKINAVFVAQDPNMEESQFSQNSLADFKANISGAEIVYLGNYKEHGASISSWVQIHNKSLDLKIKAAFTDAKNALNQISVPFGEAIISQPNAVNNAVVKIEALATLMDKELIPLIQLKVID